MDIQKHSYANKVSIFAELKQIGTPYSTTAKNNINGETMPDVVDELLKLGYDLVPRFNDKNEIEKVTAKKFTVKHHHSEELEDLAKVFQRYLH